MILKLNNPQFTKV